MYLNIRSNAKYHETIHIGRINFDRWNYFSPTMPILSVPVFHHFPSCSTLATAVPVRREVKLTFFFSIATINARLVDMYITFLSLFFLLLLSPPAELLELLCIYTNSVSAFIALFFLLGGTIWMSNLKSNWEFQYLSSLSLLVTVVPLFGFAACHIMHQVASCATCVCVFCRLLRGRRRERQRGALIDFCYANDPAARIWERMSKDVASDSLESCRSRSRSRPDVDACFLIPQFARGRSPVCCAGATSHRTHTHTQKGRGLDGRRPVPDGNSLVYKHPYKRVPSSLPAISLTLSEYSAQVLCGAV